MANVASKKWSPRKQKQLDRLVQFVGWLLFAISFLSWLFSGVPVWFVLCLCLTPWIALAAVIFGKGRFLLIVPDGKTVVNIVLSVPLGLMVGALLNFNIIDWQWPVIMALAGGALYLAACHVAVRATIEQPAVARRVPRKTVRDMILVFFVSLVGAALSWATIMFVNALRDVSPSVVLSGTVTDKSFSGGKSHSYYLHLNGRPTILGIDSFRVSKARYTRTQIGQVACIIVHHGILHLRFYEAINC